MLSENRYIHKGSLILKAVIVSCYCFSKEHEIRHTSKYSLPATNVTIAASADIYVIRAATLYNSFQSNQAFTILPRFFIVHL
jgi:hypothetical protein